MKKPHVLDADDIKYLQENEDKKILRRKPSKIILLVLIILIAFFGLVHFLENFVASEKMHDKSIGFREMNIVFSESAINSLQNEYLKNQHREIKACLFGKREKNTLFVESVDFPKVVDADVIHIESFACPVDAVGDVHSHPVDSCIASQQDINTLNKIRSFDPEYIMLIMCAKDRFALVK